MAVIKEYREFFLRNVAVNSGTKPDQEVGYATQYLITVGSGTVTVYNRFLKGDYPSEGVYTKLYESIAFKLNKEDTASLTGQGLAIIASDTNARTRNDSSAGTFTSFVVPYQLPNFKNAVGAGGSVESTITLNGVIVQTVHTVETVSSVVRHKRDFILGLAVQKSIEIDTGTNTIQLVGDLLAPGNRYYYGTNGAGAKSYYDLAAYVNTLITVQVPAGTIVMYSGSVAPTGWTLCDGSNGSPDLRGKFIVALGQDTAPAAGDTNPTYVLGDNGGENTHQLTYNELPKHSHSTRLDVGSTAAAPPKPQVTAAASDEGNLVVPTDNEVYSDETLGSESTYSRHENRPPYYALAFIMKL